MSASLAARERQFRAAQREAEIGEVRAREAALVSVHKQNFPMARRIELPGPEDVDPEPIEDRLEREIGIQGLVAKLGGGDSPPVAAELEPVDRYALMREHRKRARQGIPIFKVRDRIRAAQEADRQAEAAAEAEVDRRRQAQRAEQERLDQLWLELEQARNTVRERLPVEVEAEESRRAAKRESEQAELDAQWAKLEANEPATTIAALERAFADTASPAASIDCEGKRMTVVMQFAQPQEIVPERKPATTPGGKRTLKKRTKTEINAFYLEALGSHVLATIKRAFAVAPGTDVIQILVARRAIGEKHAGELAAIYAGEFDRAHYADASGSRNPGRALLLASGALLERKGTTEQIVPIDLSTRSDLQEALAGAAGRLEP